jgi:hypothetical protein
METNKGGETMMAEEGKRTRMTRAWIESNAPPLDDLAPALGISVVELIDYMRGRKVPDRATQELLAEVFGKKVKDLF